MSEPNLIAIGWLAGLRSRGITVFMRGNRVAWLPFPSPLTESEMAILKAHRQAIKDAIRAAPAANLDGLTADAGGAGGAGDEDRRSASNAGGVNPFVTSDAASSPTILVASHLDADGKKKAALARDEELKRTRPHIWRIVHGNEAAVQAEVQAELDEQRTREMLVALGLRSSL